ncbi:hypothetical protein B0H34DRAFT_291766 [Crassisporium funariophilum]|nr:hypothetical protein B0H34DRAFT_291766 [Crassisporium funariophilum]
MAGNNSIEISFERKLIRTETIRLTAALSSVRSQLQSLVPISQLPAEILEEIFDICVSWLYEYQKATHRHSLAWTQVCCSWRRISIDSSRLWHRIDLCNFRYAAEFLVRSKEAPLSILSASPPKVTPHNLTLHAGRLHSIDIYLFPDDMVHLFASIGGNLKNLTSLSLRVPPAPSTLFLGVSIPRVRRLALDGVAIPWDRCQDLTYLTLRGLDSYLCPSVSQLHGMFVRSPYLKFVRLQNIMPPSLALDICAPIPLPYLTDMIISANSSVVSALLENISIGSRTRLQLYFSLHEDVHTLFPHGLPHQTHPQRLDVGTVRLSRYSACFFQGNPQAWSDASSMSVFAMSSASALGTHVCNSLPHLLDLWRITTLEFNTAVLLDIPRKSLLMLFVNLVNLESLYIAFNDLEDLLSLLSNPQLSTTGSASEPLCPHLVTLSFSKPVDLWWHFGERWLRYILEFVLARIFLSLPIHTLEFLRCHGVSSLTTKDLQEVVPVVIVSEQIGKRVHY